MNAVLSGQKVIYHQGETDNCFMSDQSQSEFFFFGNPSFSGLKNREIIHPVFSGWMKKQSSTATQWSTFYFNVYLFTSLPNIITCILFPVLF